jgi:hypothetical protein
MKHQKSEIENNDIEVKLSSTGSVNLVLTNGKQINV